MLETVTNDAVFHFILIFARLGTAFSYFPGVSSSYLFGRGRLILSLAISLVMYPIISSSYLPPYSPNYANNLILLLSEIMIGLIISIASHLYFNSIHFVGQTLAMQSGLASAMFFDPSQKMQVAVFSNFMLLVTIVTIFAADVHHLYIQAVGDSYVKFPPGDLPTSGDISNFVSHVINDSFILAFKLSAPFMVISLAVLTGSGLLSRLMPNLQVFFVITPAQIIIVMATMYVVINFIVTKLINYIINSINILGF